MKYDTDDILKCAVDIGLDPFPTDFHTVPANVLYDIAARGLPGRYSHWSHGKEFYDGITRHDYRFGRIYELVINSNPCQAFLLDTNSDIINLMIKAHVYGHSDFFKNNRVFEGTDRESHINVPMRAERIKNYEEIYGEDEVRKVIDHALTVEFYVDQKGFQEKIKEDENNNTNRLSKNEEYNDILNIDKDQKIERKSYEEKMRYKGLPCNDILSFLIKEAPVEDWQKDIMSIVRLDGLQFIPQIKTKIANEGWASFVHQKIMRQLDIPDADFMEYAQENANVVSAHSYSLNPYWLGLQICRDIEEKYGMDELLKVRRLETDASFLRNYLTEELVEKLGLIRFAEDGRYYVVQTTEWEKIRDGLINDLTDRFPDIQIVDKNYDNKGELYLKHNHNGKDLKKHDAIKVLKHLRELWKRDVYLETYYNNKPEIWKS